jgi:mannosyltransferase OCH1-like enzyme
VAFVLVFVLYEVYHYAKLRRIDNSDVIWEQVQFIENSSVCRDDFDFDPEERKFLIPPIIHQSWKNDWVPEHTQSGSLSYPYKKWIQSWTSLNKNWIYMFWTDEDNLMLFQTNKQVMSFLSTYHHVGHPVARADFSRYAYLYVYGGIYADIDFECLRPFDDLVRTMDAFLSAEPLDQTMALYNQSQVACNAIMGSRPGHPFWMEVLKKIRETVDKGLCTDDVVKCTGPRMVQSVYESYVAQQDKLPISMLPSQYFYPELAQWNNDRLVNECKKLSAGGKYRCKFLDEKAPDWNSYAVHHWACQWCRGHSATKKNKITNIVPPEQFRRPFR